MQKLEELKEEGQKFLDCGYQDLDDAAKMIANSYMRGLKDGQRLVENQNTKQAEPG